MPRVEREWMSGWEFALDEPKKNERVRYRYMMQAAQAVITVKNKV